MDSKGRHPHHTHTQTPVYIAFDGNNTLVTVMMVAVDALPLFLTHTPAHTHAHTHTHTHTHTHRAGERVRKRQRDRERCLVFDRS